MTGTPVAAVDALEGRNRAVRRPTRRPARLRPDEPGATRRPRYHKNAYLLTAAGLSPAT
jgi:hypothetical protein